uniref:Gustatory receptor n=1 Tax=Cacopsylla melanoneura TaxID=428564 RepID=A0A8D8ZEH8_9HEMI
MRSLVNCYRKCVLLCGKVNKICSLQLFFSISLSFALVITLLFLGSLLIIQKARGIFTTSEFFFILADLLIMIVIQLGKLMYLINVCSNTCNQAEKILQLGRKVIIEDKSPELTYELSLLVKMMKEEKVQFTAHDFFPIDYPLFISFIGATTTYWVIMVQFQLQS